MSSETDHVFDGVKVYFIDGLYGLVKQVVELSLSRTVNIVKHVVYGVKNQAVYSMTLKTMSNQLTSI